MFRIVKAIFKPHPILKNIVTKLVGRPESHDIKSTDGSTVTVMTQGLLRTKAGIHALIAVAALVASLFHINFPWDVDIATDKVFQIIAIIEGIMSVSAQQTVKTYN